MHHFRGGKEYTLTSHRYNHLRGVHAIYAGAEGNIHRFYTVEDGDEIAVHDADIVRTHSEASHNSHKWLVHAARKSAKSMKKGGSRRSTRKRSRSRR